MSTDRTVNPWQRFKGLLPGGFRTVITVTSNNGDGTSNGTLRDGTAIVVRGESVAAGKKALVVDGEMRHEVPALAQSSVNI